MCVGTLDSHLGTWVLYTVVADAFLYFDFLRTSEQNFAFTDIHGNLFRSRFLIGFQGFLSLIISTKHATGMVDVSEDGDEQNVTNSC